MARLADAVIVQSSRVAQKWKFANSYLDAPAALLHQQPSWCRYSDEYYATATTAPNAAAVTGITEQGYFVDAY